MIGLLKDIAQNRPKNTSLLGLDVGKKTIGLALSPPDQTFATPLHTIKRTKFMRDMVELIKIIEEYEVGGFVIGLPVNMDGTEGPRAQSIRDFAIEMDKVLEAQTGQGTWIALWDERLSTESVEDIVDEFVDKRKTKINSKSSGLIDKLAAQIILDGALSFLEHI